MKQQGHGYMIVRKDEESMECADEFGTSDGKVGRWPTARAIATIWVFCETMSTDVLFDLAENVHGESSRPHNGFNFNNYSSSNIIVK